MRAMIQRIRELLDRFPEWEELAEQLIEWDPDFAALCQEYEDLTNKVRRLEEFQEPDARKQAGRLRGRRNMMEEEILTRLQEYRPL